MLLIRNDLIQIIMVAYFRPNDLTRSVSSILSNTEAPYHLSIIDNSHGGIDDTLQSFARHPCVTIYRNETNLGKGRAFMRWYSTIMANSTADHFISIDGDIEVPPNWLRAMQIAAHRIRCHAKLGLLAPALADNPLDTFSDQLRNNSIVMHNLSCCYQLTDTIWYNRHTAGPLLLIDRDFFEKAGGYAQDQLYGNDDGRLCAAAARHKRFIGIATDVTALHLNADADAGYRSWKRRNIAGDVDGRGYWD